jgi:hypothetical protein
MLAAGGEEFFVHLLRLYRSVIPYTVWLSERCLLDEA